MVYLAAASSVKALAIVLMLLQRTYPISNRSFAECIFRETTLSRECVYDVEFYAILLILWHHSCFTSTVLHDMASSMRIRLYREFLTPALHRRFTTAAGITLLACYVEAVLIGDRSSCTDTVTPAPNCIVKGNY